MLPIAVPISTGAMQAVSELPGGTFLPFESGFGLPTAVSSWRPYTESLEQLRKEGIRVTDDQRMQKHAMQNV